LNPIIKIRLGHISGPKVYGIGNGMQIVWTRSPKEPTVHELLGDIGELVSCLSPCNLC
jgi:hypothetical protein